jgi:hypothetical protein
MRRAALALLLLSLGACGDDDAAAAGPDACVTACPFVTVGGCLVSDGSYCTDYPPQAAVAVFSESCTQSSGTWHDEGCPTTDRVGTCIFTVIVSGTTTTLAYRYYSPMTAAEAAEYCTTSQPDTTVEWIPG